MKIGIAMVATAALLASPTLASQPHVRALLHVCDRATVDGKTLPACKFFILGEVDGLSARGAKRFCLPKNAGPEEKLAVVRKYLDAHPETMSLDAGAAVADALAASYPCGRHS